MNAPKVILASNSPRRQQFFHDLGIPFHAESADIDESPALNESPTELVTRLALAKALTVAERYTSKAARTESGPPNQRLVIGADTVVAVDGTILGKPANPVEARAMLIHLRARPHHVHTALAIALVVNGELMRHLSLVNSTTVTMRAYTDDEIAVYIATGDPMDKAGAYAIQHPQFRPVQALSGCPASVMGLPAADLLSLLSAFNVTSKHAPLHVCPALTGLQCCQITTHT